VRPGSVRRSRLSVRLFAVLLVPLTALGWQFVQQARERSDVVARSGEIEAGTEKVVRIVALGAALVNERAPTGLALATHVPPQPGWPAVRLEGMSAATGIDLAAEIRGARSATDVAARAVAEPWVADVTAALARVRAAADGAAPLTSDQIDELLQGLREQQQAVETRVLDGISRLVDLAPAAGAKDSRQAGPRSGLRANLRAVQNAYQLTVALADTGATAISIAGFPGFSERLSSGQFLVAPTDPRLALAMTNAAYGNLDRELRRVAPPPVLAAYQDAQESPTGRTTSEFLRLFVSAAGSASAEEALPTGFEESTSLIRMFLPSGIAHLNALNGVIRLAGDEAVARAREARSDADRAYRDALVRSLVVLLAALLGIWALNRGVTRPLARIATRARAISAGELTGAGDGRGPREVVAVAQAFDDIVRNLALVQRQAAALAQGDTSADVLAQRAPGALGESIQASVGQLSAVLQARDRLEAQLRHETTHDRLTGLLNRSAALVALEQALARINRTAGGLGVVQVDLDRTRTVNDLAGEAAGDALLREAARVIADCVRHGDVVARLGSDEFVVVAETESIDLLVELAQRIVDRLAAVPLPRLIEETPGATRVPGLPEGVGATIGVAVAFDGVADAAGVLQDAATAVRAAKARGGGSIEIFDDVLREARNRRNTIAARLRTALTSGGLRLAYQPIVAVDGRVRGFEALCRWTDPELGDVPPTVFVPAAEASDLVLDLDRWVLGEATRQIAAWDAAGRHDGAYVSVNISGRHLRADILVADVSAALDRHGVTPDRLLVEVTETTLLSDLEQAAAQLTRLRALGVRVAVDDFGTGYTSISQLQYLPVDTIKIDRSFVAAMSMDRGRSLVRMMIDVAGILGLAVVAEGVETPEELAALRAMGCPLLQGYLLGRPTSPEHLPTDRVEITDPAGDGNRRP
jgi:diguanylate cyclase (GGDEF)-like protein